MYKEPVMKLLETYNREDLSRLLGFLNEKVVQQPWYACVTNDNELVLGQRFFTLNQKQRTFAILHELLHISYGHFRFYKSAVNHKIMNIANDTVINEAILNGRVVPTGYVQVVDGVPLFNNTVYKDMDNLVDHCRSYYGISCLKPDDTWFKTHLTSALVYETLLDSPVPEAPKHKKNKSDTDKSSTYDIGSDDSDNPNDKTDDGENNDTDGNNDSDDERDTSDEKDSDEGNGTSNSIDSGSDSDENSSLQYRPVQFDLDSLGQEYDEDFDGASNPFEVYKNCDGKFDNNEEIAEGMGSKVAFENGYRAYLVKDALSRKIDWKSVVKTCIAQSKKTVKQYGFSVPNRRNYKVQQVTNTKVQLPNQCSTQPVPTVHIYVDTSWSISDYNLACMIYEIKDIYKFSGNIDLTVKFFNDVVYGNMNTKSHTFNYKNLPTIRRGGTSFNSIYKQYYSDDKRVIQKIPDVCVIITDGEDFISYGFRPLPLGHKTVWVTDKKMAMPNPKCINVVRPF